MEFIRAELVKASVCFGGEMPEGYETELAELGPEVVEGIRAHVEAEPIEEYGIEVSRGAFDQPFSEKPAEQ